MTDRENLYEALSMAEEADQLATARVLYEEILRDDPENGALQVLHAANLIELGDLATAVQMLEVAEEFLDDSIRPGFLIQKGHVAREQGHLAVALDLFREAWKLNPEDGEPLLFAASAAGSLGELAKAEYLIREAIKLPESEEDASFQLGTFLISAQRYQEGREAFAKVLELDRENELAEEWLEDLDQVLEIQESRDES